MQICACFCMLQLNALMQSTQVSVYWSHGLTWAMMFCCDDKLTRLLCDAGQVVEFVKSQEYARFSRIIFDTAPTGHTLRLLTVPDFVEATLNKLIRLRKKLGAAGTAVRGLFGASDQQDAAITKLEGLRVCCDLISIKCMVAVYA